jgi:four helix bundle protein
MKADEAGGTGDEEFHDLFRSGRRLAVSGWFRSRYLGDFAKFLHPLNNQVDRECASAKQRRATVKPIESHKDLIVWQRAIALAGKVYAATRKMPTEERYGLISQLRRAAISVPSNIAEGAARRNRTEFLQFLHIARGSLSELETQLLITLGQRMLTSDEIALEEVAEVGRLLNGLIRSLMSSRRDAHAMACAPSLHERCGSSNKPLTANR